MDDGLTPPENAVTEEHRVLDVVGSRWARLGLPGRLTVVVVMLVSVLAVMLVAPSSALRQPGAMSIIPEADGAYYVGLVGMVDRPMTVYGVWPRATVPADVLVCSPVPGALPFMTVEATNVGDHCEHLEPVRAGTRLLPNPPEGNADEYLVVHVAKSGPGIVRFCGVRVLHRVGVRLAYTNNAGAVNVVWNAPSELDGDPCRR